MDMNENENEDDSFIVSPTEDCMILKCVPGVWFADNPGKNLNKRSLISDVARPALEEALARKETITEAFKMTGLHPFDPLAVELSKLRPGDQYQQKKENPDDNQPLLFDVTHEDFILLSV